MKKILWLLLLFSLVFFLGACNKSSSENTVSSKSSENSDLVLKLKFSHTRPEGTSCDKNVKTFCAEVEEKTGGTLTFDIYPAGQLGNYSTVADRLSMGDIDAQLSSFSSKTDKALGFTSIPYLTRSYEEAQKIFDMNGIVMKKMKDVMDEHNIKVICTYPVYYGGVALRKDRTTDPLELGVSSGIKIRTPSTIHWKLLAEMLGYIPVPMSSSEIFTSLQTGMVYGAIGLGGEGYYSNFADLINTYYAYRNSFELWHLQFSSDTWKKLSENQRKAIQEAAKNLSQKRWATVADEETEYEKKMIDKGIKVVKFTDEEIDTIAKKVRNTIWPQIKNNYGEGFLDKVVEKYDLR